MKDEKMKTCSFFNILIPSYQRMPTRNQSGKPEHLFQNPNRKRKKSHKRLPKAIRWYATLLQRKEKEGETNWIKQTMKRAKARLDKM